MSQASIKEDRRVALQVSRELNANPPRASAIRSTSAKMETLIPKRRIYFKSPGLGLPETPVSMASTPKIARSDGSSYSSFLSSLESYESPIYNAVNSHQSYEESPSKNSLSSLQSYEEPSPNNTPQSMTLRLSTMRH